MLFTHAGRQFNVIIPALLEMHSWHTLYAAVPVEAKRQSVASVTDIDYSPLSIITNFNSGDNFYGAVVVVAAACLCLCVPQCNVFGDKLFPCHA